MIETEPIQRLASGLIEAIQERYEDDRSFVRQAMVCVEIDKGESTVFITASADDRSWVQISFLDAVAGHLERRQQAAREEWDS